MFVSINSKKNSWLSLINKHEDVYNEIKGFIESVATKSLINPQIKKMSDHSIFDLVEIILLVVSNYVIYL